ncbi:MAG TPA: MEDS domain-containing protein, partial [Herpetosiphonaceae bacterium]|nr:MEDS domain-containing protein [Herpetosiphonaceae bacterium]
MIRAGFDDRSRHALLRQSTGEMPVRDLAPRWDWGTLRESEHVTQFYETDEFLVRTLSDFIATGFRAGDVVLVVATEAHREALDVPLRERGLDPAAARASGRYIVLDAAETLATIMRDGSPEPERVAEIVGSIVARAAGDRRRVRIFGELSALLWAEGKHTDALRLEEICNRLQERHAFMLFCAYPLRGFGGEALAAPLTDVCAAHTHALPTESYIELADPDDRLRAIVQLQQQAGMLKAEIAERKRTEAALRLVRDELEQALHAREQLLSREQAARTEAERANHLKDEFLAIVSHELRTPLTAILGWTQRLRRGRLDQDKAAHALGVIEKSAMAQARLIDDIIDASRVITGNVGLMVEQVDVAAVIDAAVDSVQPAADAKGVHVEVTVDRSARRLHGDAERLQQ